MRRIDLYLEEVKKGFSQVEIARKYGVTRQAVEFLLKRGGINYKKTRPIKIEIKYARPRAERKVYICPNCEIKFERKVSQTKRNKYIVTCSRVCLGKTIWKEGLTHGRWS